MENILGTWDAKELTTDKIITQMVGRELTNLYPPRENVPGEVVLEVKDFTSINPRSFRNVNFTLRKGEILGVGGLVGAQRTELMEGLFGVRSHSKVKFSIRGRSCTSTGQGTHSKRALPCLPRPAWHGLWACCLWR